MLVSFFKTNNASAFIFIPFIAFAIWAFGYLYPSPLVVHNGMPLYEFMAQLVNHTNWFPITFGLLMIIAEAFLLNFIINENEILNRKFFLPGIFYILFMSSNKMGLCLHPLIFANLFILLAIQRLLNSYRKDNAFSHVFDAAFLFSIASLFYLPSLVFFPLIAVALILLRPFNVREWLISLIGIVVPYTFIITFYFVKNINFYSILKEKFQLTFRQANTSIVFFNNPYTITLCIGAIIIILSFGKLFNNIQTGSQKAKKGTLLLLWLFGLSLFSILITTNSLTDYFAAIAIPAAVFSANYAGNVKKQWWIELLFLFFLLSIFINLALHYF
ncbi:MAG: DUF6427 family protein [Bacteroidia bacterium]